MTCRGLSLVLAAVVVCSASAVEAQKLVIPRRHDRPPGPALSPQEAVAKMTVPEGFTVEVVAAEPDIVNPVAMFIDEKGALLDHRELRVSRAANRDRAATASRSSKTPTATARCDKVTVFAEGLNIPSGIAVGHGGVWVANSPDLLFLQDTDGDLKADKTEVVVTGFGRTDTHELPNSLTWGPDGWLYGLNGVFNYSRRQVRRDEPQLRGRIIPAGSSPARCSASIRGRASSRSSAKGRAIRGGSRSTTRETSSSRACVIDHLWHLVETRLLHPPGRPLSAAHLADRIDRRAQAPEGRLLRHHVVRQRRLSRGVPQDALHGQHPRRLHQRRRARAERLDVQGQALIPAFRAKADALEERPVTA